MSMEGLMDQYGVTRFKARVRIKVKRELLRAPLIGSWSDRRYRARLRRHAGSLPDLTGDMFDVFSDLRNHGIAVRDATPMIPAAVLDVADELADRLRESTHNPVETDLPAHMPEITLPSDSADMATDSLPLYEWGLADENLDLAEHYIGLPVYFHGVGVRRERADGLANFHTRRWHMDIDDYRMLKIIVYLNDVVDGGCAPFEYLNPSATEHAARVFRYSAGHVSDAALARVVPPADWTQVTGPRLTAIFVDPKRVFHRVHPPNKTDRYSFTLTYTSTTPLFQFQSSREGKLNTRLLPASPTS